MSGTAGPEKPVCPSSIQTVLPNAHSALQVMFMEVHTMGAEAKHPPTHTHTVGICLPPDSGENYGLLPNGSQAGRL